MIELFHLCHTVCQSLGGLVIIPGPLPSAGGVYKQDNATMEAFVVIRNEIIKIAAMEGKKKN